jgi:hypothetical protein
VSAARVGHRLLGRRALSGAVACGALVVATLAGCGDSERPDPRADRNVAATNGPGSPPTATAAPMPDDERAGPSPGARSPGPTDTAGPSAGGSASPGAGGPGAGSSAGAGAPAPPAAQASPVFVGEACAPDQHSGPQLAVGGLVLYCVPTTGSAAGGRWSAQSPQTTTARPVPGTECDSTQTGKIFQGTGGRPVACLREPDGGFRWADVS